MACSAASGSKRSRVQVGLGEAVCKWSKATPCASKWSKAMRCGHGLAAKPLLKRDAFPKRASLQKPGGRQEPAGAKGTIQHGAWSCCRQTLEHEHQEYPEPRTQTALDPCPVSACVDRASLSLAHHHSHPSALTTPRLHDSTTHDPTVAAPGANHAIRAADRATFFFACLVVAACR